MRKRSDGKVKDHDNVYILQQVLQKITNLLLLGTNI